MCNIFTSKTLKYLSPDNYIKEEKQIMSSFIKWGKLNGWSVFIQPAIEELWLQPVILTLGYNEVKHHQGNRQVRYLPVALLLFHNKGFSEPI